jgi:hypothetical protein
VSRWEYWEPKSRTNMVSKTLETASTGDIVLRQRAEEVVVLKV